MLNTNETLQSNTTV